MNILISSYVAHYIRTKNGSTVFLPLTLYPRLGVKGVNCLAALRLVVLVAVSALGVSGF
jgi:hypothetical protein